ncbi:energy-coupling factor transporter transmembrane component T family protein [Mycoplasmopsis lipofaciens]|uniref:energy-coupling factor transporter transmembrane component T family protein n=1 Tax=Mycoplasmopsis lipofaciens TaxID=114884 RepID=UPI000488A92B|nr:energy-coupling factor transporter transmembrane component T [Mycoplasmopsis lipofaciens]
MNNPIGSYSYNVTFIHRLDPRLKLSIVITYIVLTFIADFFFSLAILLIPLLIAYLIGSRKISSIFKMLRMPAFIGIFLFVINIYTMKHTINSLAYQPILDISNIQSYMLTNFMKFEWVIYQNSSYVYSINWAVLGRTFALVIRIYIMIMATSLFVITTKPILLTKAIEDLILPLKLLFIPTHIIAMIISISLRFIPTLLDEAHRIVKAQSSRGIDFKNGKLKEKAKSFTTLIIPLFVTSFAKAEDLSNAMETRGYDPYSKRTRYRKLYFSWRDFLVLFLIIGLILFIALSQKLDFLPIWYILSYSNY